MGRVEHPSDATAFLPQRRSLTSLREAAAGCRGCHLYAPATQTARRDFTRDLECVAQFLANGRG